MPTSNKKIFFFLCSVNSNQNANFLRIKNSQVNMKTAKKMFLEGDSKARPPFKRAREIQFPWQFCHQGNVRREISDKPSISNFLVLSPPRKCVKKILTSEETMRTTNHQDSNSQHQPLCVASLKLIAISPNPTL
jgi:hypothetical protein